MLSRQLMFALQLDWGLEIVAHVLAVKTSSHFYLGCNVLPKESTLWWCAM